MQYFIVGHILHSLKFNKPDTLHFYERTGHMSFFFLQKKIMNGPPYKRES